MMEMAQSLESYSGRGWKENDIAKMLTDLYAKKIKDAGHVSLVPHEFSQGTLGNYSALLSDQENISISVSSAPKGTGFGTTLTFMGTKLQNRTSLRASFLLTCLSRVLRRTQN